MVTNAGGELTPFLLLTFTTLIWGLATSSVMHVAYNLTYWLSRYTRIDEPDPTLFMRPFEVLFERVFASVGWTVSNRTKSPIMSQLSFQLSIGVVVILVAFGIYVVTGGILIGATLATHSAFGFTISPEPIFRQVVAFVVVCGLSVMFHAGERAKQIPVN